MTPEDQAWIDKMVEDEHNNQITTITDAMNTKSMDANRLSLIVGRDTHFATLYGDRQVFYYKDGIYRPNGDDIIAADVERRLNGDKVTTHLVNEVVNHIQRRTFVHRDDFDNDANIINMDNGLYNIKTGELSPHTPKYLSMHKSPIRYNPDATCPAIDQFIEDIVPEKYVQTMYEIMGYALSPKKNLKKAFIFEGGKNSGKSKIIALMEAMVGRDATTDVTPLTVSRTIYVAAEYYGKQLNLVDDLGNTPIFDTGILKSVISGGRINAQFKYSQPFDYTPNILCIFATNEIPQIKPFDEAYASRFNIVPFPNTFEGSNDDPDILDKLTTPEELSGFFNKSMVALHNLMEAKRFTSQGTLADNVKAYQQHSVPVVKFIDECCVICDPDDYISKEELYGAYTNWSRDKGYRVGTQASMTEHLKTLGCVKRRLSDDHGGRYDAYCGVTLKVDV